MQSGPLLFRLWSRRISIMSAAIFVLNVSCVSGDAPASQPANNQPVGQVVDVSITIAGDGSPLISYQEGTKLKVAYCADSACSDARITTIDDGLSNEIVTGSDGFGLIAYISGNQRVANVQLLKVAHCETVDCTQSSATTIEAARSAAVTIGADGLPLLGFISMRNELKVAHCNDIACSDFTISTVAINQRAVSVAMTTGTDGLGFIVSSHDPNDHSQRVTRCSSADCSAASTISLDSAGAVRSVTIDGDGVPVFTYNNDGQLWVVHCGSVMCNESVESNLMVSGSVSQASSITIGNDGAGLVSYFDQDKNELRVAHCADARCSSASYGVVESEGRVGHSNAITTVPEGFGLIAYSSGSGLKVALCSDEACSTQRIRNVVAQ
jgi:predicted regulator of Ras-like GTPase activity (Roadblock/LC7/MglB family)